MIAATIGATAGAAVFFAGAWGHDSVVALDEPPAWLALIMAAAGVSVVGATTGYMLTR